MSDQFETPFKEKQAARYVGVNENTMRIWRYENRGPRYFKAGEKLIRYRRADLDEWINNRLATSQAAK